MNTLSVYDMSVFVGRAEIVAGFAGGRADNGKQHRGM